jgi:hypothetical protein
MNELDEIEAALRWFFEISDNPLELAERIEAARSHYRDHTDFSDGRWVSRDPFEGFDDRMAIILAQAVGDLRDIRTRDLYLAAETLPFLKMIGAHLDLLRRIPGAIERARRILRRREPHPDGGIFELVVALRYARKTELLVEFIPEQTRRMADFLIRPADDDPTEDVIREIHVECKRLRPSEYEKAEERKAHEILNGINSFVHENKISLCVDVTFTAELRQVPADYLLRRLDAITNSRVLVPGGYPWKDEFGEGTVKAAHIKAVHRDIEHTSLILGSKFARLLAGGERIEEHFHLVCGGTPRPGDSRFIDELDYGTVVFWRCLAEESVDARARHVRSKLADIDRQVEHATLAIAHIGMDVERDTVTADLRWERNLATVSSYHPDSQLMEVDLHYFLPRVSENVSWIIDETVEPCSRNHGPFLDNPRVLCGTEEDVIRNQPAWRQRVPR